MDVPEDFAGQDSFFDRSSPPGRIEMKHKATCTSDLIVELLKETGMNSIKVEGTHDANEEEMLDSLVSTETVSHVEASTGMEETEPCAGTPDIMERFLLMKH